MGIMSIRMLHLIVVDSQSHLSVRCCIWIVLSFFSIRFCCLICRGFCAVVDDG